jgi:hypothetical protein
MGSGHLRSTLYMCAISAKKQNQACRELYDRLRAAGKPPKLALIAVCNKLLKQAFAIATTATPYQSVQEGQKTIIKNRANYFTFFLILLVLGSL